MCEQMGVLVQNNKAGLPDFVKLAKMRWLKNCKTTCTRRGHVGTTK